MRKKIYVKTKIKSELTETEGVVTHFPTIEDATEYVYHVNREYANLKN